MVCRVFVFYLHSHDASIVSGPCRGTTKTPTIDNAPLLEVQIKMIHLARYTASQGERRVQGTGMNVGGGEIKLTLLFCTKLSLKNKRLCDCAIISLN